MVRELKRGEATLKDMEALREGDQTKIQRDKKQGVLVDYTLEHRVALRWDLNDDAIRDRMFELTIDDYTVILDAEALQRYIRWV